MKKPAPKPRNPVARQLRAPVFRKQTVPSARIYRRKRRCTSRTGQDG